MKIMIRRVDLIFHQSRHLWRIYSHTWPSLNKGVSKAKCDSFCQNNFFVVSHALFGKNKSFLIKIYQRMYTYEAVFSLRHPVGIYLDLYLGKLVLLRITYLLTSLYQMQEGIKLICYLGFETQRYVLT